MINIAYSVLSHYPSLISNECINLGILFHNIDENKYIFEHTHTWKRIANFNDELDLEFLKVQLNSIKSEVENDLKLYGPNYTIDSFTKFYVNELKFSNITTLQVEDFNDFVNETKKLYLRFDYRKEERYSHNEELAIIKKQLKSKNFASSTPKINGYFNESISFDFLYGTYAFKFFTFKDKSASHLVMSIKSWAYNAIKLKSKYKFVFVVDIDPLELEDFKLIQSILSEESDYLLTYSNLIPFIESLAIKV